MTMTIKRQSSNTLFETLSAEDKAFYTTPRKKNALSAKFMFGYLKYVKGVKATADFYNKFYDKETADLKDGAREYFIKNYAEIIVSTSTYADDILRKLGLGKAA